MLAPSSGDTLQVMKAVNFPQEVAWQELDAPDAGNSTELDAISSVLKDIILFKLQKTVEKLLFDLKKAIISQQTNPNNNNGI